MKRQNRGLRHTRAVAHSRYRLLERRNGPAAQAREGKPLISARRVMEPNQQFGREPHPL